MCWGRTVSSQGSDGKGWEIKADFGERGVNHGCKERGVTRINRETRKLMKICTKVFHHICMFRIFFCYSQDVRLLGSAFDLTKWGFQTLRTRAQLDRWEQSKIGFLCFRMKARLLGRVSEVVCLRLWCKPVCLCQLENKTLKIQKVGNRETGEWDTFWVILNRWRATPEATKRRRGRWRKKYPV